MKRPAAAADDDDPPRKATRRDGEGVRDLGNWFLSVGATSSGQHFHSHGEALNAVGWGRKRWFFLAPGSSVRASDYASSLDRV